MAAPAMRLEAPVRVAFMQGTEAFQDFSSAPSPEAKDWIISPPEYLGVLTYYLDAEGWYHLAETLAPMLRPPLTLDPPS